MGDGTFAPGGALSRQQLWMALGRLAGAAPGNMAAASSWARESGISDGTRPGAAISRQQLVTMLYRYVQMKELTGDGTADGRLNPEGTATRARFAAMMHRLNQTFEV